MKKMMLFLGFAILVLITVVIGGKVIEKIKTPKFIFVGDASDIMDKKMIKKNYKEMTKPTVSRAEYYTMVANADSEEMAKEIAELYGMDLLRYTNKVAVYQTNKDPMELIKWGEAKGYPAIGLNGEYTIK